MRYKKHVSAVTLIVASLLCMGPTVEASSRPEITANIKKNKSKRLSDRDYDDQIEHFQFVVRLENAAFDKSFEQLRARLFVFSKHTTINKQYQLENKESVAFNLAKDASFTFESDPVTLEFDDNKRVQYGYKYDGYVLFVEDKDGRELLTKTNRKRIARLADKLALLQVGDIFNDRGERLRAAE